MVLLMICQVQAYTPPSSAVSYMSRYRGYSDLTNAAGNMDIDTYTHNLTTWQMDHGGFFKAYASKYTKPWNGEPKSSTQVDGVYLGTIDNDATIQEMRLLAERYKKTSNSIYKAEFKASFKKAMEFLLTAQRSQGGWPQMWPKRKMYSDQVTFNDNAMIRTMVLLKDIVDRAAPFDSDIISSANSAQLQESLHKAVDFILNAQIVNNGELTVWCAQHDTNSYAPVGGRSYELASKSGSESAGIVWFLMNWPHQTEAVRAAIKGALHWYQKNRVADLKFSNGEFVSAPGASLWYRFYEVHNDKYFFCDRAGESTKTQDIYALSDDRRTGYQWGGDYGSALLKVEPAYLEAIAPLEASSSSQTSSSSQPESSSSQVSSSSQLSPTTPMCGEQECAYVLQAEHFTYADGVVESNNAGYGGEGFLNMTNAQGTQAKYALHNCSTTPKQVYIRYANGGAIPRSMVMQTGISTLSPVTLPFAPTQSWTTWNTETISLQFKTGADTLTMIAQTTDGAPNLDWIGWMDDGLRLTECPDIENPVVGLLENTPKGMPSDFSVQIIGDKLQFSQVPAGVYTVNIRNMFGKKVQQLQGSGLQVQWQPVPQGVYIFEIRHNGIRYGVGKFSN
jgi:PelA/Pel-15E family pectate lyase